MKKKRENRNWIAIFSSLILILLGIAVIGGKYLYIKISELESDIKIEEYFQDSTIVDTDEQEEVSEQVVENKEKNNNKIKTNEKYIAVLEIPKIKFKKGIYSKKSKLNNVNKNIYLLKESDMPDKDKGNFIIAGHSGNSYFSYFKNLPNLSIGNKAYVYYNERRYEYKLVNIYEILKTGTATIIRNNEKTTMTLITCKPKTNKQLVFIFELMKDGE